MIDKIILFVMLLFMIIFCGFFFNIHGSECTMPDLGLSDNSCPTICECTQRDYPKCQVEACDYLDCINWYNICVYKWR